MAIKSSHLPHLFQPFGTRIMVGDDPCLEGKGKPDPTIFIEAAKRHLNFDSELSRARVWSSRMVHQGLRRRKQPGCQVIVWVPDPELVKTIGDHDLEPTPTLSSWEDFVREEWGLPPY
ncbi:BQ2448_3131 [Microbotryum intermedium]|uniref:BQ2448_3131 protein n=1 Tax=Microbotryum intermedium TaxID=269621 RepID=A0A238FHS6_9BASI|nr:BQ2448_3131 [Microbotryum intermedium]